MTTLTLAKNKPNYLPNENNFPSFLDALGSNTQEDIEGRRDAYLSELFADGVVLQGNMFTFNGFDQGEIILKVSNELTYEEIFKVGYLAYRVNEQNYYFFVNKVVWETQQSLRLTVQIDYWLTYWTQFVFGNDCFVTRKLQQRFIKTNVAQEPNLPPLYNALYNKNVNRIHDNDFQFDNKYLQRVMNLREVSGDSGIRFVSDLSNSIYETNPPNSDNSIRDYFMFNTESPGTPGRSLPYMVVAFATPATDSIEQPGNELNSKTFQLPIGCGVIPILLWTTPTTDTLVDMKLLNDNGGYDDVEVSRFKLANTYEVLGKLGNQILAITMCPINIFDFAKRDEDGNILLKRMNISDGEDEIRPIIIDIDIEKTFISYRDGNSIKSALEDLFYDENSRINQALYQSDYDYLKEPKLQSSQFCKLELCFLDQRMEVDTLRYGFSGTKKFNNFRLYSTFTIAPHIFTYTCKFAQPYQFIGDKANLLGLLDSDHTLQVQKDLQIISSSSAYTTFLQQHKNSYNISLLQGKTAIAQAKAGIAQAAPHSLGGLIKAALNPVGATLKLNSAILSEQQASLSYQGLKAQTEDLARQSRQLNESNTAETYGDLSLVFFGNEYNTTIPGDNSFNTFFYGRISLIPPIQQKIVSNFYNLHGYLWEQMDNVADYNYFANRVLFDYFEIEGISTAMIKTGGFNISVLNYFNALFKNGVRLWHHYRTNYEDESTLQAPNISNYGKENWEKQLWLN